MAPEPDRWSFSTEARTGWEAALLELEHHALHWDVPEHGETGVLIAQALRSAVEIARTGGLQCEHRGPSARRGTISDRFMG